MMLDHRQLLVWKAGMLAGLAAFGLNLLIARVAVRVLKLRPHFAPLTAVPLFAGSLGGALGATAVYALALCSLYATRFWRIG